MNIIYARMSGYDWVSTPSDAVARELEALGHTITIVEDPDLIPCGDFDFVWSPYESVTILGDIISNKYGIPHFSHIEVIPPWRYFEDCDIENYNITPDHPDRKNLGSLRKFYSNVGKAWSEAAIKSVSNHTRVQMHCDEFGVDPKDVVVRYPSIDVKTIELAKKQYSPQRRDNVVLTVSRLTEIKRLDLLVKIMNKIKSKVTWRIVGEGSYRGRMQNDLTNKNVTLEFVGPQWGWGKFYHMMSTKVSLYAFSGMPPLESALLGSFPIVIENQATKHFPNKNHCLQYNFGSILPLFQPEEIDEAAAKLDEELQKPAGESLKQWNTVRRFFDGGSKIRPSEENAQNIVKEMEKWIADL